MNDYSNYSLLAHNTFGIEAKCKRFVECETSEEALEFAHSMTDIDMPLLIIGGGSNLLLTADYPATVVRSCIRGIELLNNSSDDSHIYVRCGSGETWDDVVDYFVGHGCYGAENLSLIPGDVGASAVQNIGAYGVEVKDIISSIEAIDLQQKKKVVIAAADCDYGYRSSRFKGEWKGRFFITHVVYRLQKDFNPNTGYGQIKNQLAARNISVPTAKDIREVVIDIRRSKLPDPKIEGNAGSFFVNPIVSSDRWKSLLAHYPDMPYYILSDNAVKIPAGWLIEQCGWKGQSLGRAGVYKHQALVLLNRGGATGNEILNLCNRIIADVEAKFHIKISPEVNIV